MPVGAGVAAGPSRELPQEMRPVPFSTGAEDDAVDPVFTQGEATGARPERPEDWGRPRLCGDGLDGV